MALRPSSLLKQAQRILSPRTSSPIPCKSPLNVLSIKYNSASPAATSRLTGIRTPIALRSRSKTSRKLLYTDDINAQENKNETTPEITVNKCAETQENRTGTPKCKRIICFDSPIREAFLKEQEFTNIPVLGKGSFGIVVKARYKGKQVAIKLLKANGAHAAQSIHNERNALCLKHKNIVNIYQISYPGPNKESGFVMMEFIPNGTTLQSFIGYGTPFLSWGQQLSFISQITGALKYIHEKGILHLDVKPANILLVENAVCKLCDFGSSRRINELRERIFSPHEFLKGTMAYMSPEILLGATPTVKSDVYSLGILMWQLENQLEPYELHNTSHSGPDSVIYRVIKHKLRPVSNVNYNRSSKYNSYRSLYEECWNHHPNLRPFTHDIIEQISEIGKEHR